MWSGTSKSFSSSLASGGASSLLRRNVVCGRRRMSAVAQRESCRRTHRVRVQQRQHLSHDVSAVLLIPPGLIYGALEYLQIFSISQISIRCTLQSTKYLDYVGSISRGHEEEREVVFGGKLKILSRYLQTQREDNYTLEMGRSHATRFIHCSRRRSYWPPARRGYRSNTLCKARVSTVGIRISKSQGTIPKLRVPVRQVLIRYLSGHVEHQYTAVCAVVVRRVHPVEALLPSRVPKICSDAA